MAITSTLTHLVISFICFVPVEPNLDKVAKTQFVLFNQTSSLWCPAQGAPAPFIVWRKNGIMVQNSTSVKYKLTITEENNNKYSCEVKTQDGFDKGEIRLVVESEFFHNKLRGWVFKETAAPRQWGLLQDDLVLPFAERNISPWRRANPLNVSFRNSSRWQIFIVNSVDKTKLLIYKQLIHKSVRHKGKYTAHLQSLPNRK